MYLLFRKESNVKHGTLRCSTQQLLGETFKLKSKRHFLHAPLTPDQSKAIAISKVSKTQLVEEGLILPADVRKNHFLLPPEPKRSLRRAVENLGVPYPPYRTFWKSQFTCFRQGKKSISVTATRLCSKKGLLSILYEQHVLRFWFLTSNRFFWWMCFSISRFASTQKTCTWSTENQKRLNNMNFSEKKLQTGILSTRMGLWSITFIIKQ